MTINKITLIICSFILGIGILGAGYSIGKGIYIMKKMSRSVSIKGIAEKDVKSDLAIWEISYRQIGNDLIQIDQNLQKDQETITAFLQGHGFTANEISRTQIKIEDRLANIYNQTQNANDTRYVVTAGLKVRTTQVDVVAKASQEVDQLLRKGILLTFDSSTSPNPSFYYTHLDDVRAPMMAAATKSASTVAVQFARDANCKLGGIQRANQGVFQVMSSDTSTLSSDWNSNQSALGSINKKIRLVSSFEYSLR